MTIKQQGGVFGRNPSFNDVDIVSLNVSENGSIKQLAVGGDFSPSFDVDIRDSDPAISLRDTDANNSQALASIGSNVNGALVFRADPNNVGNFSTRIDFCVDGTVADAYLDKDKNFALVNGNLVIGTSGKGIDFSATSGTGTSELFDDYEEGTWTPVISDAASGGNIGSATTAAGHYVKVGRVVTVAVDLVNIDTTGLTSGNYLYIGGLPFTAFSGSGSPAWTGSVLGANTWSGITTGIVSNILENTDYIRFIKDTDAATGAYLTVGDVNSGATDARFSMTYFAA